MPENPPRTALPRPKFELLLLVAVMTPAAVPARGDDPIVVTTRRLEIEYSVNDAAQPLEAVELYVTTDQGATWSLFGEDEDRQSPMTFAAPDDGAYGFYFVLKNAAGASSAAPVRGSQPQTAALLDQTPPLVQLHAPRVVETGDPYDLQLRWSVFDSLLGPRPIELSYRRDAGSSWLPMTQQPLANTGRFDWRIPDDLTGTIAIRLTARDRGGNTVSSEVQTAEIPLAQRDAARAAGSAPVSGASARSAMERPLSPAALTAEGIMQGDANAGAAPGPGAGRAKQRAERLLTEAVVLGQRGEVREAITRTREAVKLDPESTAAFTEMGDLLLRLGDLDRSLNAYEIAIRQKPTTRGALIGAARVHTQRKDYPAAAERLRTVLRYNPADAEVWLNLGDVAIFRGDEIAAREYYLRATQIDPAATEVIEDARKRLQIMADAVKPEAPRR